MWWDTAPFWIALAGLWAVAMARGQATYWIARVVTEQTLRRVRPDGGWRAAVHTWLQGEGLARGRRSIERWGLVVVPVSYLTVGFQTLVLAAAGVLRIGWLRFTLAQLPGAVAWGLIYATVGFAVWEATLAAAAGSPAGLMTIAGLALALLALVVARRTRARRP